MNLIWRESALDELEAITCFIAERNPAAAQKIHSLIVTAAERLSDHPFLYRTGRIPGTREAVVHPNYIVIYRVGAEAVEIVNVLHSRRQYPPED